MQDASSADFADHTDLNRSVQPSSDDLASQYGPHSFPTVLIIPALQVFARLSVAMAQRSVARGLASRAFAAHHWNVWRRLRADRRCEHFRLPVYDI
jgi:hypothetical protein